MSTDKYTRGWEVLVHCKGNDHKQNFLHAPAIFGPEWATRLSGLSDTANDCARYLAAAYFDALATSIPSAGKPMCVVSSDFPPFSKGSCCDTEQSNVQWDRRLASACGQMTPPPPHHLPSPNGQLGKRPGRLRLSAAHTRYSAVPLRYCGQPSAKWWQVDDEPGLACPIVQL
jgi:hypothetical protein